MGNPSQPTAALFLSKHALQIVLDAENTRREIDEFLTWATEELRRSERKSSDDASGLLHPDRLRAPREPLSLQQRKKGDPCRSVDLDTQQDEV